MASSFFVKTLDKIRVKMIKAKKGVDDDDDDDEGEAENKKKVMKVKKKREIII